MAKFTTNHKRWQLLVGPRGSTTCLYVGDPRRDDRYRRYRVAAEFNQPMTPARVRAARVYGLWLVNG